MKKKKAIFYLLPLLLTGCHNIKNQDAIYSINVLDNSPIELLADNVINLIEEKYSFPLLIYTSQCGYCDSAKENINKYVNEYKIAIYQIEIYDKSLSYLNERLPNYFPMDGAYPVLFILNKGIISYKSKINDLTNYSNFKKLMNAYLLESNLIATSNLDSFKEYQKDNLDYLLFIYNSSQKEEKFIYQKYIYPNLKIKNKNIVILDYFLLNTNFIDEIKQLFEIENDDINLLSIVEKGEIKTTLSYLGQSDSEIQLLVDTFFGIDTINSAI